MKGSGIPRSTKTPLVPPFACLRQGKAAKGDIIPPFGKACLPVGRGGWEGFSKGIF